MTESIILKVHSAADTFEALQIPDTDVAWVRDHQPPLTYAFHTSVQEASEDGRTLIDNLIASGLTRDQITVAAIFHPLSQQLIGCMVICPAVHALSTLEAHRAYFTECFRENNLS